MDLFIHDFERDTTSPLTFSGETNTDAIWAPDGAHLVFRSRDSRTFGSAGGFARTAPEVRSALALRRDRGPERQCALTKRRSVDLFAKSIRSTGSDIWVLPIDASDPDRPKAGPPEPFLRTPASETRPAFSHDGRWVAYTSNDTGVLEVYVRPFALARLGERREVADFDRGWSVSHLVAKRP